MVTTAFLAGFGGLIALAGWGIWSIYHKNPIGTIDTSRRMSDAERAEIEEYARKKKAVAEREAMGVGYAHTAEEANPKYFSNEDMEILASNGNFGLDAWGDLYKKLFGYSYADTVIKGLSGHSETRTGQDGDDGNKDDKDTNESEKGDSGGFLARLALGILQTLLKIFGTLLTIFGTLLKILLKIFETVITHSMKFIWLIGAFLIYKIITKEKK